MQPPIVTIDNRLSLKDAARKLGKSPSCVWRWMRKGVAGEHLAAAYFGGSLYTSEAALNDFARRVAEAKLGRPTQQQQRCEYDPHLDLPEGGL